MELKDLKDASGFDSFFEYYKHLKNTIPPDAEYVTHITKRIKYRFGIIEIKAEAMDEIFQRLPTTNAKIGILLALNEYHHDSKLVADTLENMPLKD